MKLKYLVASTNYYDMTCTICTCIVISYAGMYVAANSILLLDAANV